MLKINNLTIIGTSHIAIDSVNLIKKQVLEDKPDVICLELDKGRFQALVEKKKRGISLSDIRSLGINGFIFLLIGSYVQKKLGSKVGLEPGADMLAAINLAIEHKISVALVDQDIRITLQRFSKSFKFKDKWNMFKDILRAIFMRKKEIKRLGLENMDLTKVPQQELIDKLMVEVKQRYPGFYKVIVEERNVIMSKKISSLIKLNPDKKVLAVVGAGHEKEMFELIKQELVI